MRKERKRKEVCPYCGDAPVNHAFSYFGGVVSLFLDPIFESISLLVPKLAVRGAEKFLKGIFQISRLLGAIRLSDDPERAVTLRSRVAWDEARRRGIEMRQVVVFGKPTDNFRAKVNGRHIYFNSLPLPERPFGEKENWDDKFFLNEQFQKMEIPVPKCAEIPASKNGREKIFDELEKPIIVKPRVGSRGRHTTTNVRTFPEFEKAFKLALVICPKAVAEEHLFGYVCRATCIGGKLSGFYRAEPAKVTGNGRDSISELIRKKDDERPERVEKIKLSKELEDYISRQGWKMEDILPSGADLELSHRTGRLFGGLTREMLDELHPSFVPVLEKAASVTGLAVIGFDCIIPDPEKPAESQRWGIIEGNTLPFIDLHYYALSGKPRNIAGLIWNIQEKEKSDHS